MTKIKKIKAFFKSIRKTQNSLQNMQMLSEQIFTQLTKTNKPLSDIKIQTSLVNKQEELQLKYIELNLKIEAKKIELLERINKAQDIIFAFPKKEHQAVLQLYYCVRQMTVSL